MEPDFSLRSLIHKIRYRARVEGLQRYELCAFAAADGSAAASSSLPSNGSTSTTSSFATATCASTCRTETLEHFPELRDAAADAIETGTGFARNWRENADYTPSRQIRCQVEARPRSAVVPVRVHDPAFSHVDRRDRRAPQNPSEVDETMCCGVFEGSWGAVPVLPVEV